MIPSKAEPLDFFLQNNNVPIESDQNAPLHLLGLCSRSGDGYDSSCLETRRNRWTIKRRYTRKDEVQELAISKYKINGRGITFNDIISSGLAVHKEQAQSILKRCLQNNILFVPVNHKPQQYYPARLKAEIFGNRRMSKNYPIRVTEVGYSYNSKFGINSNNSNSNHYFESIARQSLEGYVLPLLPSAPLYIHKMQFKLRIASICYHGIELRMHSSNKCKEHEEIIGNAHVKYCFYSNGTVMVFVGCANRPFKLEDESDRSRLMAFFGQVRDRLVILLMDSHERITPDILEWELTQFDINKDIKVGDWFQFTGVKIQVRHLDHLFRIYIKSKEKDTVCRVEESVNVSSPSKSAVQAINNILNPLDGIEQLVAGIVDRKLDERRLCSVNDCGGNGNRNAQDRSEDAATTCCNISNERRDLTWIPIMMKS